MKLFVSLVFLFSAILGPTTLSSSAGSNETLTPQVEDLG